MIKLKVEIAEHPHELSQGLMYRQKLGDNNGMLFKFQTPLPITMWGKNTYIPLDVAFVDRNNNITEIRSIAPLSTRMITSQTVSAFAIEANAGYFEQNGIKPGTKIQIHENKENKHNSEIEFNV